MAKLALNKSSLQKETAGLKTFRKFLPSLELKRKQLMAENTKAQVQYAETAQAYESAQQVLASYLTILAGEQELLAGLLQVTHVELAEENIVGTRLPVLIDLQVERQPYSFLTTPAWLDDAIASLEDIARLRWLMSIQEERALLLGEALRKTTQRVNLFDKVLIPRTVGNIRKIKIFLSDVERAEVVRAKISKAKHDQPQQASPIDDADDDPGLNDSPSPGGVR